MPRRHGKAKVRVQLPQLSLSMRGCQLGGKRACQALAGTGPPRPPNSTCVKAWLHAIMPYAQWSSAEQAATVNTKPIPCNGVLNFCSLPLYR